MKDMILDGGTQRDLSKVKVSENKNGDITVNGRSLKQGLYDYRRRYGEKAYRKLLKRIDSMPDLPREKDEGNVADKH